MIHFYPRALRRCQDACVSMDFDGRNEFYSEATRRARKAYRCCECGDPIAVGESHHYAAGKSDGMFWDNRTCAPCHEIRTELCCDGWVFEMLWESISDQFFPSWYDASTVDCLAKLSDLARAKLAKRHADYVEDQQ